MAHRFIVHSARQDVLAAEFTPSGLGTTANVGLVHQRYGGLPLTESRKSGGADDRNRAPDSEALVGAMVALMEQQRAEGEIRLREVHARLDRYEGPREKQITVDLALSSRLALGLGYDHPLENGLLFHTTLGVPYLPATALKGLLRAWVTLLDAEERANELFGEQPTEDGTGGRPGILCPLDALPTTWPRLAGDLVNCHLPAYYSHQEDGDWPNLGAVPREAPRPATFLAVEPGTAFRFRLLADPAVVDLDQAAALLADALALIGMGARRGSGYGRIGEFTGDDFASPASLLHQLP